PTVVADVDERPRHTPEVQVSIPGRSEHPSQHTVEEAAVARHDFGEYLPADILGMDVRHAIRMTADQPLGIDAAEGGVARVDDEADTGIGVSDELLEVFRPLDHRAQMEVIGEAQPPILEVAREGAQPLPELGPLPLRQPGRTGKRSAPVAMHGVAALGDDEHAAAE